MRADNFDPVSFAMGKAAGGGGGGDITVESLSVTENGEYTAPTGKAYSPVTVDVQAGDLPEAVAKDVNLIDYDGKILYSYTAAEFAQLSSLPANPSHDGLTAQGWNWSLSDAKSYVAAYGMLWIGQQYVTSDGKTRIYIHLEPGRLAPYLELYVQANASGWLGTVVATVDWGDGTSATDYSVTNTTAQYMAKQHTYAAPGDYVITITYKTGTCRLVGAANGAYLLIKDSSTTSDPSHVYRDAIRRVEIGSGITVASMSFRNCYRLRSITIPTGALESDWVNLFQNCTCLEGLVIPSGVTAINDSNIAFCRSLRALSMPKSITSAGTSSAGTALYNCLALPSVAIPPDVTIIGQSFCQGNHGLTRITIPAAVTSIGANAFAGCYGLAEIHFKSTTPPSISNSNAFSNVPTDCKIFIPAGKRSAYTGATNYPSSSSYTYVEE